MTQAQPTYVVITPARDEEACLPLTIASMVAQSLPPAEWIIVDDGSRDRTPTIIAEYARRYPWIHGLRRADRGRRASGAGVAEAFYDGYHSLRFRHWSFLVKLDADLSFAPDFFLKALAHFRERPRLGIAGACLYKANKARPQLEKCPRFHVRGATKIYGRRCWQAIGGIIVAPGWDVVDEVRANMLRWETAALPDLVALHHRPTGAAESRWHDSIKSGKACYVAGYHPLFMALKCMLHLSSKPYLLASLGMGAGFLSGYLGRVEAQRDPAIVNYVHEQQWHRLWGGSTMWR
jgi:glycosyltransferase involved in cell wall biosynthesis